MTEIFELTEYADEDGNTIKSPTTFEDGVVVKFRGKNNRLTVHPRAKFTKLQVVFDCDNGRLHIGAGKPPGFNLSIRVGEDSVVKIGNGVTSTGVCIISAVEGAKVTLGDDVMLASHNQIRSDDGHPIFDVRTGLRVNPARDIVIGDHVWLGAHAVVLGGGDIGAGSVIGFRSLVTRRIPNNCIAVGSPAEVVRKNVAWERPHLSFVAPGYKPDISTIEKSEKYWNETVEPEPIVSVSRRGRIQRALAAKLDGIAHRHQWVSPRARKHETGLVQPYVAGNEKVRNPVFAGAPD